MNQKHLVIMFFILMLIGLSGFVFGSVFDSSSKNISPTPTPAEFKLVLPTQSQASQATAPPAKPKHYNQFPGLLTPDQLSGKRAVIMTDKGNIEFDIYPEATKAASNFILLALDGYYDGITFHRVVPGFVIQGGDPTGTGRGGPGYQFEDEPVKRKYDQGIVAMANSGPNTNGSQFFIMLADNPQLPPNYTIFGKVVKGQEVVNNIQVGDVMRKVVIEKF